MTRTVALAGVLVALSGCRTKTTVVSPQIVANYAKQLLEEGEADVVNVDGETLEIDADEEVDVLVKDVDGDTQRPMKVTIRDLVAGCVNGIADPTCLAGRVPQDPGITHRELRFDKERTGTLIGAGVLGGVAAYGLAVGGADVDFGRGALYVGVGAIALMGLFMIGMAVH